MDHGPVLFRQGGEICRKPRHEFAAMAEAGEVDADTIVFDNTLTTVGQLRAGAWEIRAGDTWHGRAFFGTVST